MTSRDRDFGRKYVGGAEKERKRKAKEEFMKTQEGAMHKFLKIESHSDLENKRTKEMPGISSQNLSEIFDNKNQDFGGCLENTINIEETHTDNYKQLDINTEINTINIEEQNIISTDEYKELEDIGTWPLCLTQSQRTFLIEKGLERHCLDDYPKDEKNRFFSEIYYNRKMSNGELIDRPWLIYSKQKNRIFCFACKLFRTGVGQLETDGFNNWQHTSERLKQHEVSKIHFKSMDMWNDARKRLTKNNNIIDISEKLFIQEKQKWRNILERIISIIQFLSEHNMALRGSSDRLFTKNNGNFLGLIELISRYDSVLMEHVNDIKNKKNIVHYLSKNIQNELISLMGNEIRKTVTDRVRTAKYFSILLDCTPDTSHEEQLSCIIRYVYIHKDEVQICESFTDFLVVKDSSGLGLTQTLKKHLMDLGLDLKNCRGQGYDNGANMKGHKSGVQAQLLRENQRAFFTPCGCHNLNLILSDIASVSPKAITFFGVIQRIYTFLSASNHRYDIAKKYLKLTPKALSETRWECRIESVKAIRFQIKELIKTFEEILSEPKDAKVASEAQSLLKEIKSYQFVLSTVIWYELLVEVNRVSKVLQQKNMQMDVAISLLENLLNRFSIFRTTGYDESVRIAKDIAENNDIISYFPKKRVVVTTRQFDYECADEAITQEEEKFRIKYFLLIIDQAIQSFNERFKLYQNFKDNFGFLYSFRDLKILSETELRKNCNDLYLILQDGDNSDINGVELFEELRSFIHIIPDNDQNCLFDILKYLIKTQLSLVYPNIYITLRILLTLPVTIASSERSFSKLKLIKNYLRSSISQERLSGLAMISIENEISHETDFNTIINAFAAAKARKMHFI